jgi:hypothetical protein
MRLILEILGFVTLIKLLPRIIWAIIWAIFIIGFLVYMAISGLSEKEHQPENRQTQNYQSSLIDSRDNKQYKTTTIGNKTWMAENLNYNANGSKCYKNNNQNCTKYGRLYDWNTAKNVCPSYWHLPSRSEWDALIKATGLNVNFLTHTGGYGNSYGDFYNISNYSYWWTSTENDINTAYIRSINDNNKTYRNSLDKNLLLSVRCVKN